MITAAPPLLRFVCPRCQGELRRRAEEYRCQACGACYPVVAGIADFRLAPDPWIGIEEDRAKALRLEEATRGMDFEESVRAYWQMTPDTPRALAERFARHVLGAAERSREWLARVEREEPAAPGGPWLELGCGTGDLLAAAAQRDCSVVGIDIALRWLVIARKRPELRDAAERLVCCGAEALPFPEASFARVLSLGLLEHCARSDRVLSEARRVLQPGGMLRLRTHNRYSLLPEPHVGVWGVGFVPRNRADRYVSWRSGQRYLHHRPLSRRELTRALHGAGLRQVRVAAAPLLHAEAYRLGPSAARLAPLYGRARGTPLLREALAWVAPLLEAHGRKP
ncbi:hypothetical protein BH24GEM3_BH24GEM3_12450 [soil metagenome]